MKKTIGFIDYYIDEWHSNNYPKFIADSRFGKDFEVVMASEVAPFSGRRALDQWCADMHIQAASPERIVAECDAIIVLAPNNPEQHETLAEAALASGKPVYMDKTFAPSLAAAKRLFARAEKYGTPLMSTSALRYAQPVIACATPGQCRFYSGFGGGLWFGVYAVHLVEMLVALCGTGAEKVMVERGGETTAASIAYADGRMGRLTHDAHMPGFRVVHREQDDFKVSILDGDAYFARLIDHMLEFFTTGKATVDPGQTCEVIAIVEALLSAETTPGVWVKVPKN